MATKSQVEPDLTHNDKGQIVQYGNMLDALHRKWYPHDGQKTIGTTLISNDIRQIFIQCGRKFGKTEIVIYLLWRWAICNPGAACYYISPYGKQSKEIVWAPKRIQNFGPSDLVAGVNNTELRITLTNDSFIKCDGSDNFEAHRGIAPHIIVYDEFKDFRSEYHDAMSPNLAVHNAPLIIVGTPPDHECQYTELAKEFKEDPDKAWFRFETSHNPYISEKWLEKEKATLFARGDEDVWYREYEAKFVKGGKKSIFPQLEKSMVRPHMILMKSLARDIKKLNWYCIADPGSTSCFGVLYAAINPYSKQIYLLDEIYESDQRKTSTRIIGGQIIETQGELNRKKEWLNYRDEAAAWFETEMSDLHGGDDGGEYYFAPAPKKANKKDTHLSLIKDCLLAKKITFSDRCTKMYWEMENYVKDKNGKIPKENDHLIDCLRYMLEVDGYILLPSKEPVPESLQEDFRGATIEQDIDRGMYDPEDGIRLPINMEGF